MTETSIEVPSDDGPSIVHTFATGEEAEQWADATDAHQALAEQADAAQQAMRS